MEPDLGLAEPNEERLSPNATETTLYARNLTAPAGSCVPVPSTCYEALVTPENDIAKTPFGAKLHLVTSTADGKHVVLLSDVPLTPGAADVNYYEWERGQPLKLINVLPIKEGGVETEQSTIGSTGGESGTEGGDHRHAISNDGSRVFWARQKKEHSCTCATSRATKPRASISRRE